jgi:predicted phage tail protein
MAQRARLCGAALGRSGKENANMDAAKAQRQATREVIGKAIDLAQGLLEDLNEMTAITEGLEGCRASLVNVRADHDRAMIELEQQKALVEAARADAQKAKAVASDISAKIYAEMSELLQQRSARQAEIDAQLALIPKGRQEETQWR